jgi:hypothetical protein
MFFLFDLLFKVTEDKVLLPLVVTSGYYWWPRIEYSNLVWTFISICTVYTSNMIILENQLRSITPELMAGSSLNLNHRYIYLLGIFYDFFTRGEHYGPGHFILLCYAISLYIIVQVKWAVGLSPAVSPSEAPYIPLTLSIVFSEPSTWIHFYHNSSCSSFLPYSNQIFLSKILCVLTLSK